MNEREIKKLVIVSLAENFSKSIANEIAQSLDMIFCDAKELLTYQLSDLNALSEKISKSYLDKEEKRVLTELSSYEDVVISINFDLLFQNLKKMADKALIVFVKLPKAYVKENGSPIDSIAYDSRSQELEQIADLTISLRKTDKTFVCAKILEMLRGIL